MDDLEERISDFVTEWFRMRYRLESRIPLPGETATLMFAEFEKVFHVDLTRLRAYWDRHAPNRHERSWGIWAVLANFGVLAVCLHFDVGWMGTCLCMVALTAIAIWLRWKMLAAVTVPITVKDLVEAARAGSWVKTYDE